MMDITFTGREQSEHANTVRRFSVFSSDTVDIDVLIYENVALESPTGIKTIKALSDLSVYVRYPNPFQAPNPETPFGEWKLF